MSDQDNPFRRFAGRGERTIFVPNPGGRRPVAPAAPAAPAAPGPAPAAPEPEISTPSAPPAAIPVAPTSGEEWISTPTPAPQPGPALPRAAELNFDDLAAPHENPIMRAAGPLLLLLGRLRVAMLRASFASLMEQVAEAVQFFEKDIRSAGIPEDQAKLAKYILCATADDIVQNIPTEDRHVWTQYSMLSRFFGERIGGVRFFEELDRAKLDPLANYPVLELQHACLALGFQGVHRTSAGGPVALQQIQRNLYETLRRVRPKVNYDLSPRWKGQALASRATRFRVPTWVVASVTGFLLFALYVTLRWLLSGDAGAAEEQMATVHASGPIEIARRMPAPPPPPPPPPVDRITQLQRVRAGLGQIPNCQLDIGQTASSIYIRVCDLVMFESGEASVLPQFKPIAARMAATIEKEHGWIKIVGHTDSNKISTVRFPSNWHLSIERARQVAALLKQGVSDPARISVDGKGDTAPVASNSTPEGRARNRRVEVLIERTD